jgi:hypothetical protein
MVDYPLNRVHYSYLRFGATLIILMIVHDIAPAQHLIYIVAKFALKLQNMEIFLLNKASTSVLLT